MVFLRLAAGCGALLLVSGCSHLLRAPAQYTSLPVSPALPGERSPTTDLPDAALPAVVIPGQPLTTPTRPRAGAVEPYTALRQSERARMAWRELRPDDLMKLDRTDFARSKNTDGDKPLSTGSVPRSTEPSSIPPGGGDQDREKSMSDLLDRGGRSMGTICSKC